MIILSTGSFCKHFSVWVNFDPVSVSENCFRGCCLSILEGWLRNSTLSPPQVLSGSILTLCSLFLKQTNTSCALLIEYFCSHDQASLWSLMRTFLKVICSASAVHRSPGEDHTLTFVSWHVWRTNARGAQLKWALTSANSALKFKSGGFF